MSYPFYSTLLLGIIKIGECIWHLSRLYPTSNVDRGLDIVLFSSVKREGLIVEKKRKWPWFKANLCWCGPLLTSDTVVLVGRRAAPHWLWTLRECVVEWPTSHGLFREKCYTFFKSWPSFNPKKVALWEILYNRHDYKNPGPLKHFLAYSFIPKTNVYLFKIISADKSYNRN